MLTREICQSQQAPLQSAHGCPEISNLLNCSSHVPAAAPGAWFSSAAPPLSLLCAPVLLMVRGAGDATTPPTPASAAARPAAPAAAALAAVRSRPPAVPGVLAVAGVFSRAMLLFDRRERAEVPAPVAGVCRPAPLAGVCRAAGTSSRACAGQSASVYHATVPVQCAA